MNKFAHDLGKLAAYKQAGPLSFLGNLFRGAGRAESTIAGLGASVPRISGLGAATHFNSPGIPFSVPFGRNLEEVSRGVMSQATASGIPYSQAVARARQVAQNLGHVPLAQTETAANIPNQPFVRLFRGTRQPYQTLNPQLQSELGGLESQLAAHRTTGQTTPFSAQPRLDQLRSIARPQYFADNLGEALQHAGPAGYVAKMDIPRSAALQNIASGLRDTFAIPAQDVHNYSKQMPFWIRPALNPS